MSTKIELLDYQKEAVKFAIKVPRHLLAIQTGRGKSLISVFYARLLLNKNLADKVILFSTKTGVNSFHKAFKKRVGVEFPQYDEEEEALEFFRNDEKIMLAKHSMIEKLGFNQRNIDAIRNALTDRYQRVAIVIDEVHKLSNNESNLHQAFMNISFAFERVSLQTATPWGSGLEQLWGITHLIYPKLWKSKRAFYDDHIEEEIIRDYKTHKVLRRAVVSYHDLDKLREKILPFCYFYYPQLDLNFVEHKARLKDYTEYDKMCWGVLTEEELGENNK